MDNKKGQNWSIMDITYFAEKIKNKMAFVGFLCGHDCDSKT